MKVKTNATNPIPKYIYMPLPDGKADVFIYKLIEELDDGYEYESNEFRTLVLTESDIASDPFKYLDYEEHEKGLEERIAEVEEKLNALTFELKRVSDSVIEVIKKDDSELPAGDYANPIQYINGSSVEIGKFYWFDDFDIRQEALKSGMPADFNDVEYFDVVQV